jgi:hypothetical protein
MTPTIAYLLAFVLTGANGSANYVTVPGIASLEECQYLATLMLPNATNRRFSCHGYKMATPMPAEEVVADDDVEAAPAPRPYILGFECHAGWSGSECETYRATGAQPPGM